MCSYYYHYLCIEILKFLPLTRIVVSLLPLEEKKIDTATWTNFIAPTNYVFAIQTSCWSSFYALYKAKYLSSQQFITIDIYRHLLTIFWKEDPHHYPSTYDSTTFYIYNEMFYWFQKTWYLLMRIRIHNKWDKTIWKWCFKYRVNCMNDWK